MKMSAVQFPAILPAQRWKRTAHVVLGSILGGLMPGRADAVVAGQLPPVLGRVDRFLLAAHVWRQLRAGTPEVLAPLHAWLWSGEQAVRFHEIARGRFATWWQPHHREILAPLQALMNDPANGLHTLCEIGCGSGLVLEDVAASLPGVRSLVGLDLSAEQVRRNQERPADPRIRYAQGDAVRWVPENAGPGWCFFTNAGVLEYFPRDRVEQLLQWVASAAPSALVLIEPLALDYDLVRDTASRPYNRENSLCHNYPMLLRERGFEVRFQHEQFFEGFRWLLLVAVRKPT